MEKKKYEIIDYLIYFIIELSLYFYSVSQISEVNSIFIGLFVYFLPFIFFYEGLYFRDKEYNYAQALKVGLLVLLSEKYSVTTFLAFSLFTWLYSLCKNVFFWQQIYSKTDSENDRTNHKNTLTKIVLYYLINYLILFEVFYSCRVKFLESLIIFGIISIFYFLILFCKSITYSPYFCIPNIKKNSDIPDSSIRFSFIGRLSQIDIHEFYILIPVICGFLYIKKETISIIFTSILLLFYICITVKNNFSVYKAKIVNLYLPLLIQLLLSGFFIFILHNYTSLNDASKTTISNIIVTVVSADLIFNFTAMFILLQENFTKYNSIYLLKNTVTKTGIFVSVIIPCIFISLLIIDIIPIKYFIIYSIFCITLCISISIWLLCSLKRTLNTPDILLRLMSNTNSDVIRRYSDNHFDSENNDIDTILKITTDTISKKDYLSTKSIFYLVLQWMEKYRKDISIEKKLVYFESQNNFYSFFIDTFITSLSDSKSSSIIKEYLNEVYNLFRFANIEKEYKQYHIFYNSLKKLAIKLIKFKDSQFDELLRAIYNTYTYKSGYILSNLKYSEMKESFFILESDEFRDFCTFYYEPIEKIVDEASKNKNIFFLKRINLFSIFFQYLPDNITINCNFLEILHKTTHCYSKILKDNYYDKDLLHSILYEYKSLQHYLSYLKTPESLKELILNVIFNSISSIYSNLLNNKTELEEHDLKILYEYFFEEGKYNDSLRYLQLFFYVLEVYFDYSFNNLDSEKRNYIWSRVNQLESIFLERNETKLYYELETSKNKIIDKFPAIDTDYDKWESSRNREIASFKEYRDKFIERYGK